MKKLFLLLLLSISLFVNAQTVDDVIQKYSASLGGLPAFNAIKTAKMTGTLTVQGMDLPITIIIVNGKAVRSDVEVMETAVVSAYKDGKGWKQNQFAGFPDPTEVSGIELSDLQTQSYVANMLMDYKARGHQVELQGKENVDGKDAFKVKLTNKLDGKTTLYYIKADDYTLIKSISDREIRGASTAVETIFSDLKEIKGIKFYMSRVQRAGGEDMQAVKFDNIEFDVPVDEKIFDKP